jgi:uncharacterized membrane protein YidH (DUF202 family)
VAKKSLSPASRVAIGLAVFAMGIGVIALGVHQLWPKANKLAAGEFAALPLGMTFAFFGVLLALPPSVARTRVLIAALMVSALALTADWIAFGPGELGFRSGLSFSKVRGPLQIARIIGRILFVIGAVLANLLALWAWVRFFWRSDGRGVRLRG